MTTSTEKQRKQVNNIFQTLIEATEHFHKLIKEKELKQSIFILSSIVEGFNAISVNLINTRFANHKKKIEKDILKITQLLEKGNFTKINEILQFSFLPLLKKTSEELFQETGEQNQNKVYSIGVFNSFRNPREFYTEDRVNALVQESER